MTPVERAYWAEETIKVTADAFDDVEKRLIATVLSATSADQAWDAVLAHRAFKGVRAQLKSYFDTGKLEREAANRRAAD